ncbi:MAG: UDP-N-acetylglucosamine 2-epimerase, partial [Muribaculaceae bacterium]|nr:UDP-N-acetylglucosamine 2-epimerase [Muribaculaceae bacterium]
NAAKAPYMSRGELEADLGWSFGQNGALLLTLHPETLSSTPADVLAANTMEALDRFPHMHVLITYPNNDPEGEKIIRVIEEYRHRHRGRVLTVPSLGRRRYMAALRCVDAVVGNSSSGLTEVSAAGVPTVNIGNRQAGRDCGSGVVHCSDSADAIAGALATALAMDRGAITCPYLKADTLELMTEAVATTPLELLRRPKRFYDIEQ